MNRRLTLEPKDASRLRLVSADWSDLESLRQWKNAHARWFFHKDSISVLQQREWFIHYLRREHDYMFLIATDSGTPSGCLGFRRLDGLLDGYNLIRGTDQSPRGTMRAALLLMASYAEFTYRDSLRLRVLVGNPALQWYERCGFLVEDQKNDYVVIKRRGDIVLPEFRLADAGEIEYA